jgi:hypothetical protein
LESAQGSEGRIIATLRVTGDEFASVMARCILDLYHDLDRRLR